MIVRKAFDLPRRIVEKTSVGPECRPAAPGTRMSKQPVNHSWANLSHMRRVLPFCLTLVLAACDMPPPEFGGLEPVRVAVNQSVFDVRLKGKRAHAIRLTPEWAPRPEAVMPRAVAAMQAVSGCKVARVGGDAAVMIGALDCGEGPPPVPTRLLYLDCDLYLPDDEYGTLDCHVFPRGPAD